MTNLSKNLIENKFENYASNKSNIDIGSTRGHVNKVGANRPAINRSVSKRSKGNIKTEQNSDLPVAKELGSFDKSNFSMNLTYGSQVNSSIKDNEVANKATSQSKSNADAPVAQSIGLSFEKIAEKRGSQDTSQNKIQSTTKVRRDTKSSGELINKGGHQELSVPLKDNQASLLSYSTSRQSPVQNGKTLNVSFGNQSNSAKSQAKQAENHLDQQTQAVLTFGKVSSIGHVITGPIKGHSQGHRSRDSHFTGAVNHKPSISRASGYRDELARVTSMASYNSRGTQPKISAQDIYQRLNRDDAYDFQKKAAPIKAIDASSTLRYETQAADHVDANGYYGQTSPEDADSIKDGNYLKKYAGSSLSGEKPTMNSSNGETGIRDSNSRQYREKYIDLEGGIQNITSKSTNQESQAYLDGVLHERRQRYYRKDVNQNLVNFNNGDFRSKRSATDQSTGVLKPVTAKSLANFRPSDEEQSPETVRNKIKSMMRNENDKVEIM